MIKMSTRLVNEKTLEINITHEEMSRIGIGAFGFTQQQESKIGGDVLLPCRRPLILQYKAAKSGADGQWARFRVNNNKRKNQHLALNAVAKSGLCDAYYVFPLIISDAFLSANFGNFISFTCIVPASSITGGINWKSQSHSVIVKKDCGFTVKSEEVTGKGIPAREFFDGVKKEKRETPTDKTRLPDFIRNLIESLDYTVRRAGIHGQSEHTILIVGAEPTLKRYGYLQLPIRIKGLQEDREEEKIVFS